MHLTRLAQCAKHIFVEAKVDITTLNPTRLAQCAKHLLVQVEVGITTCTALG